jgi:hypothetical protein
VGGEDLGLVATQVQVVSKKTTFPVTRHLVAKATLPITTCPVVNLTLPILHLMVEMQVVRLGVMAM